MENLSDIKEIDKRVLDGLVIEFGEDFLNFEHKEIGLYGADKKLLTFFKNIMGGYLQEKKENVSIDFGQDKSYNIDVGFFLRVGFFEGINKY